MNGEDLSQKNNDSPVPAEKPKREKQTLWRLVDVRCAQLEEAVKAGKIPFVLGLTWAFVWSSALYFQWGGYLTEYAGRYEKLIAARSGTNAKTNEEILMSSYLNSARSLTHTGVATSVTKEIDFPPGLTNTCLSLLRLRNIEIPEAQNELSESQKTLCSVFILERRGLGRRRAYEVSNDFASRTWRKDAYIGSWSRW